MAVSLEVLPIGQVTVAARAWKHRGRRLVTAIVKVTCLMRHDQTMVPAVPQPIVEEEQHLRGNPVASLVRASDLALLVPEPEVVVVGSAYAEPGRPVTRTTVRFAVQRASTMLINKRLEIIGDRRAAPGGSSTEPVPFEEMPLSYERALGGMASRENPVGKGMAVEADGLLALPNIELPGGRGVTPAGLGPIPSAWPARQKRRGSMGWAAANRDLDVTLTEDFDDAYYQTAPIDQRTKELRGGDLIAIVNMHPELPMLRTYVPHLRGVALAQTARGERHALPLRLDTIHLEPRQMSAELVFRGATVLLEHDLEGLRIAGGMESAEQPLAFPDLSTIAGLVSRPASDRRPQGIALDATAVIPEPGRSPSRPDLGVMPRTQSGTMVMEPAPEPAPAKPVMTRPVSSLSGETRPHPHARTVDLGDPLPVSLPFDKSVAPGASATTTEATPWGGGPRPAVPAQKGQATTVPLPSELPALEDLAAAVSSSELATPRRPALDATLVSPSEAAISATTTPPELAPKAEPAPPAELAPPPELQPSQETPAREEVAPDAADPAASPPNDAPQPTRKALRADLYKKLKR